MTSDSPIETSRGRLLVFAPGISEHGGAAKQSRTLLQGLSGRGWNIVAICRTGTLNWPKITKTTRLLLIEVPGFNYRRVAAVLYLLVACLIGLITGFRARAVLAIQLRSPGTAGGLCSKICKKPLVLWTITSGPLSEVDAILQSRLSSVRRRLLSRATVAVAQTRLSASELSQILPDNRILVIPNPTPSVPGAPPLAGRPTVLYAGRFSEIKDLPLLVRSWREVVDVCPRAHLSLVGGGGSMTDMEGTLENLVSSLGLAQQVSFSGWAEDLTPFFSHHDIFVLPSRSEGMSNSLLEACNWRRVIVASNIGPNAEVLGDDYPLLFSAGNKESLAEKLLLALTNPDVRKAALRSIEARISLLDIDSVLDRWDDILLTADKRE